MDTGRLTRWLTLGANLGVLIGIVLVLVELDQNRDMMQAQTRHELAMGIVDLLQTPAENAQLADLLYRANNNLPLSPAELFQFHLRTNALFRYWEDVHYQYRVGLYDEMEFARQRDAWKASLSKSARGKAYWCQVRLLYSPDFAAEMDRLVAGSCEEMPMYMNIENLSRFAANYTAAWNSGVPGNVASFFAEGATLSVNANPATGREAITAVAKSFMDGFPDLELSMDKLEVQSEQVFYHWTFKGTNTGPGGTGNAVNFSGQERWTMGPPGLIAGSRGQFDAGEYQYQLEHGVKNR